VFPICPRFDVDLTFDVGDFAAVTTVPAKGGAAESIGGFRMKEKYELESFRQPDVLKLCCRGDAADVAGRSPRDPTHRRRSRLPARAVGI
jgi:hypothetical protein